MVGGLTESDTALVLFQQYGVSLILASHFNSYVTYQQGGIDTHVTGGMGAPLLKNGYHHFLILSVGPSKIDVTVVKFPGKSSFEGDPPHVKRPIH